MSVYTAKSTSFEDSRLLTYIGKTPWEALLTKEPTKLVAKNV